MHPRRCRIFCLKTLTGQSHEKKNDGKALHLITTLSILWLGRVSGKTASHAPYSLGCKTGVCLQPDGEGQKLFLFTAVYRLTVHYHNRSFCWACIESFANETVQWGSDRQRQAIILPHRLLGSSGGRWVGECTPVLHRCLRRHEQKAGNIRMQLCEGDRDTERACHSCAAVRTNSCTAEDRTGILSC